MKILPVRKRLSKPLASVATCASRQGNYRFRLANVFDSLFLPSRIFIIKQFFCKINFMFNFQKTRISGYKVKPLNSIFKSFLKFFVSLSNSFKKSLSFTEPRTAVISSLES